MSNFPNDLDDDSTIVRVDDNITEIGSEAINQLRAAVFAVESEIGIFDSSLGYGASGSVGSIAARLAVSINANGTLHPGAIISAGAIVGPITDAEVSSLAQIDETKLALAHSTGSLYTSIQSLLASLSSTTTLFNTLNSDFVKHLSGTNPLSSAIDARHVVSQIDINDEASDSRDSLFTWPLVNGVPKAPRNRLGALRGTGDGGSLARFLLDLNNDLVRHQLADGLVHSDLSADTAAHTASGISLDTSAFVVAPSTANTVQKFSEFIDKTNFVGVTTHQQDAHVNGIPRTSRGTILTDDGYGQLIVPQTLVTSYLLVDGYYSSPQDNNYNGDDIIEFFPTASDTYLFDSKFALVKSGDVITIFYDTAQVSHVIDSVNYSYEDDGFGNITTKYLVRINGRNMMYSTTALARIDRPLYTENEYGVLAMAPVNNTFNKLGSLIVGSPRGATALGLGFSPSKLTATRYNLYLQIYPTGNPSEKSISLPAIDVTGNKGITPGKYTLESVVEATNAKFRKAGYNYRFIAFAHNGEFGIMLADAVNNASFSITNGVRSANGTLSSGVYIRNVVGDADGGADPLGFGGNGANLASSPYAVEYTTIQQAQYPTVIFAPLKYKNFYVNGTRRSELNIVSDGYTDDLGDTHWTGTLVSRIVVPGQTIKAIYNVPLDLSGADLYPGKTILVQPAIATSDLKYNDSDYGRFIIDDVSYTLCGTTVESTNIRVYNAIYGKGTALAAGSTAFEVKLYFSDDSVGFDALNIVDPSSSDKFKRHFEIFVDSTGHTFTHERARFNQTTANAQLANINIVKVAPKLRGYASIANRQILLSIESYSSGVYSGYLSDPDGYHVGPTVSGKKGVTTRFYDETNIDYIDCVFNIDDTIVDFSATDLTIDLFPSMQLNQEAFFLGNCIVNDTNSKITYVTDGRQFGNVSEKTLSNSALDYISAGPRFLNRNGVVRGFEYVETLTNELSFRGGLALVNGKFVEINNFTVAVPYVQNYNGGSVLNPLTWALCANSSGQIQLILVSDVVPSGIVYNPAKLSNYVVDTVSWSDLLNGGRKDLTLLYVVVSTVTNSTTTSLVKYDRRKLPMDLGAAAVSPQAIITVTYSGATPSITYAKTGFLVTDLTRFTLTNNGTGDVSISWPADTLAVVTGAPTVAQCADVEIDRIRAYTTTVGSNPAVRIKAKLGSTATNTDFVVSIF